MLSAHALSHQCPPDVRCGPRFLSAASGDAAPRVLRASGLRSALRHDRTPPPHRDAPGDQIRCCRFPPGQTIPVCVVFLAGLRGEFVVQDLLSGPDRAVGLHARHLGWVSHAPQAQNL
ncbi:hypothetical protein NDU88_003195 [Pleurodeles waltl]|uniref:Uncharacterized protein n=1 Tax=Pleurodeles waltl TaxID=8319 RepID=A0AAV7W4L5_PLEWA|nr:hypothetical protein NDU88_003195 [Pleurodeles waltl]